MDKKTILLGQVDSRSFSKGQKDQRNFDLGEIKAIGLVPVTEQLDIVPSEEVQEFVPRPTHFYNKVTVQPIPDVTYINITKPENVYAGQVEVDND